METMAMYKLPEVEGFDEHWRCDKCGMVVEASVREEHQCPPTEAEQEEEMRRKHREELIAKVGDESLTAAQRIEAFDQLEQFRKWEFEEVLAKAERKYPPEKLRGMIYKVMQDSIAYARKCREKEFGLYEERRRGGMPHAKAKALINAARLEFLDKYEAKLAHDSRFFVARPLREWFEEGDLQWTINHGMEATIRLNLERTYWINKKTS